MTTREPQYDRVASHERDTARDQLIIDKYRAAWGAMYAIEGVEGTLDALYVALFYPEAVDAIPNNDGFEGRREALIAPLDRETERPSPEVFTHALLEAINRTADYSGTLRDDDPTMSVYEGVKAMARRSSLSMWSQGDNAHQAHKMRQTGIGSVRRELAQELGVSPQEAIGVIVGDKFDALEQQVLPDMLQAGEQSFVVFDDRRDNLDRVADIVYRFNQKHSASITPILSWALVGKDKDRTLTEEEVAYYNPTKKVSDMVAITAEQPEGTRALLDYDGTLSDDNMRLKETLTAVQDVLRDNHWD